MPLAQTAVVEVGDLNIINDAGNPSDGLRYLDMSYSDGLSQAAALANAQATYANARIATASEFDDLFAAAGITYNSSYTASDGFLSTGFPYHILSTGANYDSASLLFALGATVPGDEFGNNPEVVIFTDPDGSNNSATTQDILGLYLQGAELIQVPWTVPKDQAGWLLVSEATVVPVPAAVWLFGSGLIGWTSRHGKAQDSSLIMPFRDGPSGPFSYVGYVCLCGKTEVDKEPGNGKLPPETFRLVDPNITKH